MLTATARRALDDREVWSALRRHAEGDWGKVSPEDARANEQALRGGLRLLSSYESHSGETFWIITEADRSATTILLPADY